MSVAIVEGPAILVGYAYRLDLEAETPLFPEIADIIAQVRIKPSATDILATLRTDDETLTRQSDCLLSLTIPAPYTANLEPGSVVLDMVRVDVSPTLPLGFLLEIPVMLPVTRGLL
ncbi:hypothetical protein [Thalassobacter stenotrophicus]|uniref:Uncharacterized protein n=2 Tax=Thalassobacter stenotrophicus TaxID=266809 RepID=A0A0P1F1W5_9RHOB|nr:hypothetical protein [Thalassobacter stenotrophicus]CUH61542.1 hypothetical protein THS5294_02853 [Thalassobacter stenotrophicus]SHJ07595.1 hypothetical protein SAMN02744035_02507 [Thalassobacter stenotrophicus DSM 16310]